MITLVRIRHTFEEVLNSLWKYFFSLEGSFSWGHTFFSDYLTSSLNIQTPTFDQSLHFYKINLIQLQISNSYLQILDPVSD